MRTNSASAVETTVPPVLGSVKKVVSSTSSAVSVCRMKTSSTRFVAPFEEYVEQQEEALGEVLHRFGHRAETSIMQNMTARAVGFGTWV